MASDPWRLVSRGKWLRNSLEPRMSLAGFDEPKAVGQASFVMDKRAQRQLELRESGPGLADQRRRAEGGDHAATGNARTPRRPKSKMVDNAMFTLLNLVYALRAMRLYNKRDT